MQKISFDPGLTQQFTAPFRRVINKDGSFNVHRRGTTWRDVHPYLHLINMSWSRFLAVLFLGYLVVNTLFAGIYFGLGPDQLQGGAGSTAFGRFLSGFFFSAHTLSTVGYGNISPKGLAANVVSSFESLVGVLGFAVATGLLFGRVSRPSARIGFSETMVVAPYQDVTSLQFRVVNQRSNSLMELEVRPMLMTVETGNGQPKRTYQMLKLEREKVLFLPLTWTVVHPIDGESPLWGKTAEDLARLQAELLILVKAYDDTFSQTVLARHSYRHDEIVWGKRFAPAFFVDGEGDLVLEVGKVGELA
ncbi:MAG: potassium transporter [Acidobacteriia bacterium]|nr:potassium transporter [Terriglobia bacterium]